MALKKILAVVLLTALAFCMTACRESNESRYNRTDKLLAEGKYDEAVKLLDEIGPYGDASKTAMYAKAVSSAENGEYKTAFSAFRQLGNYRDCPLMITYYTARQYEDQATDVNWTPRLLAAETYDTVALFRDSRERAENCRKTVYSQAVAYAGTEQYVQSTEMLSALRDYEDSELLRRYYEAFSLEQENRFTEASRSFAALGNYRDSEKQAEEVLKRGYQKADAQERTGRQETAWEIFTNLGDYLDSFERANKPYYELGMSLREKENWVDAAAAFEHAGTYSDAEIQVKETKYMQALAKREQRNWDGAIEIFTALGDYRDSTTVQINETNYQRADALEKSGDQEAAYQLFMSLGRYGDSFARANKPYYDLGVSLREEGKWDEAAAAFEHAGLYEDAAEQVTATRYMEASALEAAGNQEAAHDLFLSLGDYQDSFERAKKPYYELGISLREAGRWEEAAAAFEHAGEYRDAKEQIRETDYRKAASLRAAGNWEAAAGIFRNLGDYKDSAVTEINETLYQQARSLCDREKYEDAYAILAGIPDYKDVSELIRNESGLRRAAHDKKAGPYKQVRNTVTYGHYEQDNDPANGPEEIEWIVLDVQGEKVLLLSKYGLEAKEFNNAAGGAENQVVWEDCSLRNWLNNDFVNAAFSIGEGSAIVVTIVDNSAAQNAGRENKTGSSDTQDRVFLLSSHEVYDVYFPEKDSSVLCIPTALAVAEGAETEPGGESLWWLRSPGYDPGQSAVAGNGRTDENGSRPYISRDVCVRPSMWIDLDLVDFP